jgi:hypothetical protein
LIQGGERASATVRESDSVKAGGQESRSRISPWPPRIFSIKKYVAELSEAERSHLQALIDKGKSPAKRLLKARTLLKADASEHGESWSDGRS